MTPKRLERLIVKGYKSIKETDLPLGQINVLIGANGAGKSNLIEVFQFLHQVTQQDLQITVAQMGGADQLLHFGRKTTEWMEITLWFAMREHLANGYSCRLVPTSHDSLIIAEECLYFHDRSRYEQPLPKHHHREPLHESYLPEWSSRDRIARSVYQAMNPWRLYHFHDTSKSAKVKQTGDIHDNEMLHADASNLAAYLYILREGYPDYYRVIVDTVRLAAPFFGDFVLRPHPSNPEKIRLEWRERGYDAILGANALSDGTLRFICLATLFLQPQEKMPRTIVLDEPELGLHPYAIALLTEMIRSCAMHTQVILATQSVTLVNHFAPEELIIVERADGASVFHKLDVSQLEEWLKDYSLGDLWQKNLLGGRPE